MAEKNLGSQENREQQKKGQQQFSKLGSSKERQDRDLSKGREMDEDLQKNVSTERRQESRRGQEELEREELRRDQQRTERKGSSPSGPEKR